MFVNTFGKSNTLNVEFQVVDSMPIGFENSLGLAVSNYSIDAETNQITNLVIQIMIKRSHLQNDSAISVARTVLHESLHAYLKVKHYGCNQGATFEELDDFDFSELLREYFLSSCSGQSEHEFMFDYMIPTMSNILSDVRDELIPINHQNIAESHLFWNEDMDSNTNLEIPWSWSEFYKSLSLGGLQNTDAFMFDYLPETSNKYKNFYKYAVEIGQNSFSQNCNE